MALTVGTNIASLNTQRNLNQSSNALTTSMERLSSGSRINSAKDDAAGLQISNRMTSQINGLGVAVRNANDGISMAQTAEGALQQSTSIMQRMRDLALQSSNGSNSDQDRQSLQQEFSTLSGELTRIAKATSFGGKNLLDGSLGSTAFQVGSNANETISFSLGDMSSTGLKGSFSAASTQGLDAEGMSATVTGSKIGTTTAGATGEPVSSTGKVFTDISIDTSVNINGVDIALDGDPTALDIDDTVALINNSFDKTGVTASKQDGKIVLTSNESFEVTGGTAIGFENETNSLAVAVSGRASVVAGDFNATGIADGETIILNAAGYASSTVTLQAGDELEDVVTRLNDASATSGVTASIEEGKLKLEAKGDITIGAGTANGDVGLTAATYAAADLGQAKVVGSQAFVAPTSNTSFKLNNTEIALLDGDNAATVAARINDAGLGITATETGGILELTSSNNIAIDGTVSALDALGVEKGTTQVATGNAEKLFTLGTIADGKVSINGKELSFATGDTVDTIVRKINDLGAGVTAEEQTGGTTIKLSSQEGFTIKGAGTTAEGAAGLTVLGLATTDYNGGAVKVAGPAAQNSGTIAGSASIKLNGESLTFNDGSNLNEIVDSINKSTDKTNVTAEVKDGRIALQSADGKDIKLEDASAGSLAKLGLSSGTTESKLAADTSITLNGTEVKFKAGDDMDSIVTTINGSSTGVTASKNDDGTLSLTSKEGFEVADGAAGTGLAALGLTAGSNAAVSQEASLSKLDISSTEGSQMAIQVLDEAMKQVDSERAKLGAVQNRFDNTISNLQNITENVSAARGRILDTDFAAETATLSKNQILQQAGTAILAQAKQLPQAVLSLLQ
ncbi:hypothetical protein GFL09_19425 [Pseudomonas stutzeri]|uniref:flagellin N-terminal helical domain-containing protein n=1 Tax=Stutzerimonas stutzeri TaxID=316 RepID=UPI001ED533EA|nr:flagellin hook IN motif-containing protein [Stutzerimonas stutzeri]MBK3869821.1 hypothetical protein [Stutzerimonas stutzeri]